MPIISLHVFTRGFNYLLHCIVTIKFHLYALGGRGRKLDPKVIGGVLNREVYCIMYVHHTRNVLLIYVETVHLVSGMSANTAMHDAV